MEGGSSAIAKTADDLKGKFSSEYMSQLIELMVSMQSTNPTNAIGLAKELIESCCKTILDELNLQINIKKLKLKLWKINFLIISKEFLEIRQYIIQMCVKRGERKNMIF